MVIGRNSCLARLSSLATALAIVIWSAPAIAQTFPLNPKHTYLRTNGDIAALPAVALALAPLGYAPGDWVRLERQGAFKPSNNGSETSDSMLGVFSSSAVLLSPTVLHRVPGAIAAGTPIVTPNTTVGDLTTDIPEDFRIATPTRSCVIVQIPPGATHLFFCAWDSFYGDNTDPNGDFALHIEAVPQACYADCDESCGLSIDDFICFQTFFALADPYADCDADGALSVDDFICFQTFFAIGC